MTVKSHRPCHTTTRAAVQWTLRNDRLHLKGEQPHEGAVLIRILCAVGSALDQDRHHLVLLDVCSLRRSQNRVSAPSTLTVGPLVTGRRVHILTRNSEYCVQTHAGGSRGLMITCAQNTGVPVV